jgi:hypothetical protein
MTHPEIFLFFVIEHFQVSMHDVKILVFRKTRGGDGMRTLQRIKLGILAISLVFGYAAAGMAQGSHDVGGKDLGRLFENAVSQERSTNPALLIAASEKEQTEKNVKGDPGTDKEWKSDELSILGVGLGVGDVDGDGKNEIVIIDPATVYVYRFTGEKMSLITEYSPGALALKSVDVAKVRPQGQSRIYVSAQNRGVAASFVLELRGGKLVPVVQDFPYFIRIIHYPTKGPILVGQKKGMRNMYEGPILRLVDKGDDLEPQGPFGVPQKIPVFGFTIGDIEGKRAPLIAVYDREDHLRIYEPSGKKRFVSKDYYGESDIVLRKHGPEERKSESSKDESDQNEFFRPRILCLDNYTDSTHDILALSHSSRTRRLLGRTKMLEEGQVLGLHWNGDVLVQRWATPKVQGVITDFAVDTLPGLSGIRLITLERKKTDWLAFLKSRSQVRSYDLRSLMKERRD